VAFPCWRYHRTEEARIVDNLAELEALGEGWADTPAAFAVEETIVDGDEPEGFEGGKEPETDPAEAPKKSERCPCDKYTVKNAALKGHVCEAPK
jgi:hypothetical protein